MIKDNLKMIYEKIDSAKQRLNIKHDIELIAVSKTRTSEEILEAINFGQIKFGENRILEAYEKFNSDQLKTKNFELHIIGHLQRNKIKEALEISKMIQSVDKTETLDVMEKICNEKNRNIDYLIEVNTSLESQKFGVLSDEYFILLENILKKSYNRCNLRGLMTVGPFTEDKKLIHNAFKSLYDFFDKTKDQLNKKDFDVISMGMSSDYEIAIEEGSNMIRIGTMIFGDRNHK